MKKRSAAKLNTQTLRRYAIARSLFAPTTLRRAIDRLGFVQADPIRAPARAQDLILRHRVKGYRDGDLERRYPSLAVDEDHFVNYGFLPRCHRELLHPRPASARPGSGTAEQVERLLAFAHEHGEIHPRAVATHFGLGRVENYWGGQSHATTQMLERLHFQGLLRVARRAEGIRIYMPCIPAASAEVSADAAAADGRRQAEALVGLVLALYAPLPDASLTQLVAKLKFAAPQWRHELAQARGRARGLYPHATVDGTTWFWPLSERPADFCVEAGPRLARLLAPFDPVVWDRQRFEAFWGWPYRFEAYTPAKRRRLGYYALPLLWGDRIIGWGNLAVTGGRLQAQIGYRPGAQPRTRIFRRELAAELERFASFLGVSLRTTNQECP